MRLGIVSDTHDNQGVIRRAVETFEDAGVEAVVHCGDVVAPFSATPFDGDWEFYAVRGNNDGEWALADAIEAFGTYLGEAGELTVDGADVAVYHGTSETLVDALVASGEYDYVLHGHTHEYVREERAGTVRINPGGIAFGERTEPPYAVVLDTESGEIERTALQ